MVKICQKQIGKQLLYREMHSNYKEELYIRSLWLNMVTQGFQNVLIAEVGVRLGKSRWL